MKKYLSHKNPFLEAVGVEGHLAFLTHVHRLQVLLALQGALLAVPPLGLLLLVQLSGHDPVLVAVEPSLRAGPGDALPFPVVEIM